MKKAFGWVLSWTLYTLGDWVSKPLSNFDCFAWLFPIYSWLMNRSHDIQIWSDLTEVSGPWGKAIDPVEEDVDVA